MPKTFFRAALLLAVLQAAAMAPAQAADAAITDLALKLAPEAAGVGALLKDVTQDMPIGAPAAAVMLGADSSAVPRISSFRDVATTLGNGLGKGGRLSTAVGAELVPAMALRDIQWAELRSYGMKLWTRTSVSLASVPNEQAGNARSAWGVQTVLYSREADKAVDLATSEKCLTLHQAFIKNPSQPVAPGSTPTFTEADQQALADCYAMIKERALNKWNPTTLAMGAGQAYFSADGRVASLSTAATGVWITGAWGMDFGDPKQVVSERRGLALTGHWRRMLDERAQSPADASQLVREAATVVALNLRVGTPKFAGLAEWSRRRAVADGFAADSRRRGFLGAELRLAKGLYLALGVASDSGGRDGQQQRMALTNFRWGLGEHSVFSGS